MAEAGRKRTFADAFELVIWDRRDIYASSCSEKSYRHVHCPCEMCGGKATSRKVEIEHWKRNQLLSSNSRETNSSFHESSMEIDSVGATDYSNEAFHSSDEELRAEEFEIPEPEVSDINSSENEDEIPSNLLEKTSVSEKKKLAKVQPLTASTRWPGRNLYMKEVRLRISAELVHWNSILQVANGRWHCGTCWEWLS